MTAAIARPQPHSDWLARIRTVGLGLGGRGVMGLGLGRSSVQAAAGNGLLTGLISYWKLDETSGNRADSHGSNTLAPINAPGYEAGKIGNSAAFVRASSQGLQIASNSALQTGDIDFSVAAWVKLASKTATNNYIAVKGNNNATAWEYALRYSTATDRFQFAIGNGAAAIVAADALGAPSTGTWYYIAAWHDATANKIYIQVNDGTINNAADAAITANTEPFTIGAAGTPSKFSTFDGAIDEVAFWKRTLSADDRTALYNGGAGLAYTAFTT